MSVIATMTKRGPMLCGGFPSNGTCYTLSSEQWIKSSSMLERRDYGAASVRINSGLWVTGGRNIIENIGTRRTTEIYNEDGNTWSQSVDLPIEVRNHCLVKINSSHVFMTGGFNSRGFVERTYVWNEQSGFIKMSNMATPRKGHACALLGQDIWVAGGYVGGKYTATVEYFSLKLLTWFTGPPLPKVAQGGRMLVVEDKLVYIVKKSAIPGNLSGIYQLEEGVWKKVRDLSTDRFWFPFLLWDYKYCN